MRYKIGIDASILSIKPTGISNYIIPFIVELSKNSDIEIILFSNNPLNEKVLEKISDIRNIKTNIKSFPIINKLLFWFIFQLPILVRREKLDVFWGPSHYIPFFLPKKIKKIVTYHDLIFRLFPKESHSGSLIRGFAFCRYSLNASDIILSVSEETKKQIIHFYGVGPSKIKVCHGGVNKDMFKKIENFSYFEQLKKQYGLRDKFAIFVSTLEPRKNVNFLIKVFEELNKIDVDMDIAIVGMKAWGGNMLFDREYIKVLGYVSDQELVELYNKAYFCIIPSLYEGFGLVSLEAAASNCAVIAANNSATKDISRNYALLIDGYDIDKWVESIKKLNDLELKIMKEKGLIESSKYDWKKCSDQFLEVIKD